MKPIKLPMSFNQKVTEVFVQILWLPISALITCITISPILIFSDCFDLPLYIFENDRYVKTVLYKILYYCGVLGPWICWLPFVIVRHVLMPWIKKYEAHEDYNYNVGESDKIVTHNVQKEIKDDHGRLLGYVQDKEYEVVHDNGNRSELSGEAWGLIFYCIFALPLRCISLILSIFALFIPQLFVCVRSYTPCEKKSYFHIFLDVGIYHSPKYSNVYIDDKEVCAEYDHKFATVNTNVQSTETDKEVIRLLEEKEVEKAFRKSDKISYYLNKLSLPLKIAFTVLCTLFAGIALYKLYLFITEIQKTNDIEALKLSVSLFGAKALCSDIMRELTTFVILSVICDLAAELPKRFVLYDEMKMAKWFKRYPYDPHELVLHFIDISVDNKDKLPNESFVYSVICDENPKTKKTVIICNIFKIIFEITMFFIGCNYILWLVENVCVHNIDLLLNPEAKLNYINIELIVCFGIAFVAYIIFEIIDSITYSRTYNKYWNEYTERVRK